MTTIKVLIIDDDKSFIDTVAFVLEQLEYEILAATDGEIGVEKALRHRPDVILCDIRMDKMHGYATVQALKDKPETKDIPVIMITGHASPYGERRSQIAGADYYLSKPVSIQDLTRTLARALKHGASAKESPDLILPEQKRKRKE